MSGKKAYVRRRGGLLVPSGEEAEQLIRSLPEDRLMAATLVRERSVDQNAFFHAMCMKIATLLNEMGDENASLESVKWKLKIAAGYYEVLEIPVGLRRLLNINEKYAIQAGSMSFRDMDQNVADDVIKRMVRFTITHLLPHMPYSQLKRDLDRMLFDNRR